MSDEKKFGARFFIRQEEIDYAADRASVMNPDEVSHMMSRAVGETVYKAIELAGLHDMTITVKHQDLDKTNLLAEGWMIELRGEKQ